MPPGLCSCIYMISHNSLVQFRLFVRELYKKFKECYTKAYKSCKISSKANAFWKVIWIRSFLHFLMLVLLS